MISEHRGSFLGSLNLDIAGKSLSGSSKSPVDLVCLFGSADAIMLITNYSSTTLYYSYSMCTTTF